MMSVSNKCAIESEQNKLSENKRAHHSMNIMTADALKTMNNRKRNKKQNISGNENKEQMQILVKEIVRKNEAENKRNENIENALSAFKLLLYFSS